MRPGTPFIVPSMGRPPSDRRNVTAAMAAWVRRYGCGPTQCEWDAANDGTLPCARTIGRRWGWARVMREVLDSTGAEPTGYLWMRQEMLSALPGSGRPMGRRCVPPRAAPGWDRTTPPAVSSRAIFPGPERRRLAEPVSVKKCVKPAF